MSNSNPSPEAGGSPARRRLPPLLRRAWYGLNQAFRRRLRHLQLTPDQYTVMRTLTEHGSLTQRELTALISSDPNTVASLINRMEDSGLLKRRPHPTDRRVNRLELLPRGRAQHAKARAVAMVLQAEVFETLHPSRREAFLRDLDLLAKACWRAAEASPRVRFHRTSAGKSADS